MADDKASKKPKRPQDLDGPLVLAPDPNKKKKEKPVFKGTGEFIKIVPEEKGRR